MTMSNSLRDKVIGSAITAGKFPESRRGFYGRLWNEDPTEAAVVIAQLTPARSSAPAGRATPAAEPSDAHEEHWLTDSECQRIARAKAGLPPSEHVIHEP
jgi:hypothetical protein